MSTVRVDFDRDLWLYVPEAWPWQDFADVDHWAGTVGRILAEAYGYEVPTRDWITESLRSIAQGRPDGENRFAYLGAPDQFVFFVSVLVGESDPSLTLESLASTQDSAATRAPDVERLVSPGLGEGVRSVRYVDAGAPQHDIAAVVQYAWRHEGLDVVVVGGSFDVVLLGDLLPAVDALACSITVVAE